MGAGEETAVDADAPLQGMENAAVDEDSILTAEQGAVDTAQQQKKKAAGQQQEEDSSTGLQSEVNWQMKLRLPRLFYCVFRGHWRDFQ